MNATSSSVLFGNYTSYGPHLAWEGTMFNGHYIGFFHSMMNESSPWLKVELNRPVELRRYTYLHMKILNVFSFE